MVYEQEIMVDMHMQPCYFDTRFAHDHKVVQDTSYFGLGLPGCLSFSCHGPLHALG